jgi:hypothetical protein
MICAVLDTNVLLSALRSRNGASFEILSRFADVHNRRHFPIARLPALKVTSPKEFLHILQTAQP